MEVTNYAAAHGCEVLAFEMQPGVFSAEAVVLNGQCDRVTLVNHAVSSNQTKYSIPSWEFEGVRGQGGAQMSLGDGDHWSLDISFILQHEPRPVGMVKVDTEGAEILILKSILEALRRGKVVHDIILETTPCWWHNYGHSIQDGVAVFQAFKELGYSLYSVAWCQRGVLERHADPVCRLSRTCTATCEPLADPDWDTDTLSHVQLASAKFLKMKFTE